MTSQVRRSLYPEAEIERLAKGARAGRSPIAEVTSDLNRRLIAKLFELVAPPSIRETGCVMVMVSEGRGEQTVRTDQDNGLLLGELVPISELEDFRAAFTDALERFGSPPCPGDVMVKESTMVAADRGFHPTNQDVDF